jgi:hypothetical protein
VPWKNELARVIAGRDGAELLELAEAALDGAALLVAFRVEGRRPPAGPSAAPGCAFWSSFTGMTALDAAAAQVSVALPP